MTDTGGLMPDQEALSEATREQLQQTARAAGELVRIIYEFEDDVEDMCRAMQEPLSTLHDRLVAVGLIVDPPVPTQEEINTWIRERVIANGGTPIPEIMPKEE